jgi:hypothetical protein
MHSIEDIKKNQETFRDEIMSSLKKDLKEAKSDLANINPKSEEIKNLKEQLQKKISKFKLAPALEGYFITEDNPEPNYYVMWDEESQMTQTFKFTKNEKRKKRS